jgi:hypothetical protein
MGMRRLGYGPGSGSKHLRRNLSFSVRNSSSPIRICLKKPVG